MLPHICPIIKALRIIFLSGYITSWLTIKSYLLGLLDCCLLLTTERCMILFYSSSVGSLLLPVLFINSLEMFIFFRGSFEGLTPLISVCQFLFYSQTQKHRIQIRRTKSSQFLCPSYFLCLPHILICQHHG